METGTPSGNTSIDLEALRFLLPLFPADGLSSLTRTAMPLGSTTNPFSASVSLFPTPFCLGTASGKANSGLLFGSGIGGGSGSSGGGGGAERVSSGGSKAEL